MDDLKSSIVDHLNLKNKGLKSKAKSRPVTQSLNYVLNRDKKQGLESLDHSKNNQRYGNLTHLKHESNNNVNISLDSKDKGGLTFDRECQVHKKDLLEKLSNKRSELKGRTVSSDTIKKIRN